MMRGPLVVRTWERSSPKSVSRTQRSRSSMPQWPRMRAASWAPVACVTVIDVTPYQVSADHFPVTFRRRTIRMACAAHGKARPWATEVISRVRRSVRPYPRSRLV